MPRTVFTQVAKLTAAIAIAATISSCNGDTAQPVALTKQDIRPAAQQPNIIVVFTDDQGYADVGVQGVANDIVTPNIDRLASDGVRMTSGYVTAPQCTPSRAALMTGKYQQRFGLDDNRDTPLSLDEITLAERLGDAGYTTGMVGKWHLEVDRNSVGFDMDTLPLADRRPYFPDERGFDDVYFGYENRWWTNFSLNGESVPLKYRDNNDYRLDVATDAGVAFIEKNKQQPFFLYLSYFAPHVPLDATDEYLSRFPDAQKIRRKYALAMMSAIDDGVGKLRDTLSENHLTENTIIYFISDNGAPLELNMPDRPIAESGSAWDGSLNDPMIGEKGMLSEGGVRVPYIVSWPGTISAGVVSDTPVSTLDVATTSLAAAGADVSGELDGINLLPELKGQEQTEERSLYWRFWNQSAIRKGDWKYLQVGGDTKFLFNMNTDLPESENVLADHPEIAAELQQELIDWSETLYRPGISNLPSAGAEKRWYDHHFPGS